MSSKSLLDKLFDHDPHVRLAGFVWSESELAGRGYGSGYQVAHNL